MRISEREYRKAMDGGMQTYIDVFCAWKRQQTIDEENGTEDTDDEGDSE